MPIKNKPGFVPRSAKYQPDHYTELFGRICAVYHHPTTKATVLIEVDADTWNHTNHMDAYGKLNVQYQAANCRHHLGKHNTLKSALAQIETIMSNPKFGNNLNDKPVYRSNYGVCYPNINLCHNQKRLRRKGNGKPFRLSDSDKEILSRLGYPEQDFKQIEYAANKATFVQDETTPVNAHEAYEILGPQTFLSGMGRSAFHRTCDRSTEDGSKTISFDASVIFR